MSTTEGEHTPRIDQLSPARAFALMLETACERFEVLQLLLRKEITVVSSDQSNDFRREMWLRRAPYCINMALAKSFVANVIRARRICEHGPQHLAIGWLERNRFLHGTENLIKISDVNEHRYDIRDNKSLPKLHYNGGSFIDETAMYIGSSEETLMGSINLYEIYRSVSRTRDLAGFASLRHTEVEHGSA